MIQKLVVDWLINYVIATVTRWLDQNTPTQGKHDARPAPIIKPKGPARKPKYPVSTAPGTFNSDTGTWN